MAPKLEDLVGVISRQRAVKGELHRHGPIKAWNYATRSMQIIFAES
jgi:hypothetical protein